MSKGHVKIGGRAFIRWLIKQRLVGEGTTAVTITATRYGDVFISTQGSADDRLIQGGILTETEDK